MIFTVPYRPEAYGWHYSSNPGTTGWTSGLSVGRCSKPDLQCFYRRADGHWPETWWDWGQFPRVVRMLATMIAGGNALADTWTSSTGLWTSATGCRSGSKKNSEAPYAVKSHGVTFFFRGCTHYIENSSLATCKIIAEKVARQARMIIKQKELALKWHHITVILCSLPNSY